MDCQDIAQEIERNLDFLSTALQGVPKRHRSMRAVFDHSWGLLSDEERRVLRQLSVFRGGFRREAAEAVAGAGLPILSVLMDRSWLRATPSGRYEMHELIRQYCDEALRNGKFGAEVRDRHSAYYMTFLQEREPQLRGQGQREAIREIVADIGNVRAAWNWSVEQGDLNAISQYVESLWHVAESRGWVHEAAEDFHRATRRLREQLDSYHAGIADWAPEEIATTLAEILHREAFARLRMGMNAQARRLCEESLTMLRPLGNGVRQERAREHAKLTMGMASYNMGSVPMAFQLLGEGLAHADTIGDVWGTTRGLRLMGWYTMNAGRYLEAEDFLRRAVAIWDAVGGDARRRYCLGGLSWVLCAKGEFERAEKVAQEGLQMRQELAEPQGTLLFMQALGRVAIARGDYELAQWYYQDALALAARSGMPKYQAACLRGCGWAAYELGDYAEAKRLFGDVLAGARDMEDRFLIAGALVGLGYAACGCGQVQQARQRFCQTLEASIGMDLRPQALDVLVGLSCLAAQKGETEWAAELLVLVLQHPASDQITKYRAQQLLSDLASELSPEELAAATGRGQVRELEATIAELLMELKVDPEGRTQPELPLD